MWRGKVKDSWLAKAEGACLSGLSALTPLRLILLGKVKV